MNSYAVVTFGTAPRPSIFSDRDRAIKAASSAIGKGSCTVSRVYECDSRALARTADISRIRPGEQIVWSS